MSLLGTNVFANPTTPLWGSGGGGGGSNATFETVTINEGGDLIISSSINEGTQLIFNKDQAGTLYSTMLMDFQPSGPAPQNLRLTLTDQSGLTDVFQLGDVRAYGIGNSYQNDNFVALGDQGTGSLGLYLGNGGSSNTISTYATFASNSMALSNVTSINGVPYSPPTQVFDYQSFLPAGFPLAEAPNYSILNQLSFVAPTNGKLYMEQLGTYVGTVVGGTTVLTFSVNGTPIADEPTKTQSYDSNINFIGACMTQIDVSAGLTYDVSAIGQCSALPPAGSDAIAISSRLHLLFTPA